MEKIRFGTDGWRATLDEFTVPRVRRVVSAIVDHLDEEGIDGPVAVGYDARDSSPEFAEAVTDVLRSRGRDVKLAETDVPTPTVAWAVADKGYAGAIVITASHNPPEYNGIKFVPGDGAAALPPVMEHIKELLSDSEGPPADTLGTTEEVDFVTPHADHSMELIDPPALDDLHVVYDAMHGSGREATPALLERAGATVTRLRCEKKEGFGGVPPEPSEDRLGELIETVKSSGADLGLANDGDADRLTVVSPERGYVDGNLTYAVLYDYLLESQSGPAVRTVSTTFLVDRIAEAHGEETYEVPVGFKWVGKAMAEHDALIGGEESDGFTIRGHIRLKDGVLMALCVAAAAAERSVDDRLAEIEAAHGRIYSDKTSVACPDDRKEAVLDALGDDLPDELAGVPVERVGRLDGFKLFLESGAWVLFRPSGTEPKLRVNVEAESEERVAELLEAGAELAERLV